MKKITVAFFILICCNTAFAQDNIPRIFHAHLYNEEYQVWMDINFYDNDILVPSQEIFGELPGYFGAKRDTRKWIITDASINGNTANINIINDYGSEDLNATLTYNQDGHVLNDGSIQGGSYTLSQKSGSTMKIVVNRKWLKIPKKLVFNRLDKFVK